MILDCEKLESILLANWTKFIQYRVLLGLLTGLACDHLGNHCTIVPATKPQNLPNWTIQRATFTRFEYNGDKFIAWVEYVANRGSENVSLTSEFNITASDFIHVKTINS